MLGSPVFRQGGRLWLVLSLLFLHFCVSFPWHMPWPLFWMALHVPCFLRWQQVWQVRDLNWGNGALLSLVALFLVLQFHPWQVLVWIILLMGFTGGCLSYVSVERPAYALVLLFLGTELLLGAVPKLFNVVIDPFIHTALGYGLVMFLPILLLLPEGKEQAVSGGSASSPPDLLQGTTLSLLAALLALGGVFVSRVGYFNYLSVLALLLLLGGSLLFLVGWLFSPRAGLRGLARVWADSLFNLGTPVLDWISELSLLAREPISPEQFLDQALGRLTRVPGVKGMCWSTRWSNGRQGEKNAPRIVFPHRRPDDFGLYEPSGAVIDGDAFPPAGATHRALLHGPVA